MAKLLQDAILMATFGKPFPMAVCHERFLRNEKFVCIASMGDPLISCKEPAKNLQRTCKEPAKAHLLGSPLCWRVFVTAVTLCVAFV
jgi:hypothetical protein